MTSRRDGYVCFNNHSECLIVDCGAVGASSLPAHGHGDALSIEWSVAGERFIIDAGVYEYSPGLLRDYSRSTYAHNTLTLNKENQSEFWSSFRVGRRANVYINKFFKSDNGFFLDSYHDGFIHLEVNPIHRRIITAKSGFLSIEDRVLGGFNQDILIGLLLSPNVIINQLINNLGSSICYMSFRKSLDNSICNIKLTSTSTIEIEDAKFSINLGHIANTKRILLSGKQSPSNIIWEIEVL